ncbi:hypothetical protein KW807_01500, partial [Candidatus Parcubacteria bacterium]|nr:hypothetical protein [Candidatus Parcubacteria bacterium]
MNEDNKLIQDQFSKLPPELQKAIQTVPWKSSIKEIALLNDLNFEQVSLVERETMFVIYGFENPADYIGNLVREVHVEEEVATTIAGAVNEKIFNLISLKAEEFSNPQVAASSTPMPEVAPANLPMVEPGEIAHTVQHVEGQSTINNKQSMPPEPKKEAIPLAKIPDYRYKGGKDPYRASFPLLSP